MKTKKISYLFILILCLGIASACGSGSSEEGGSAPLTNLAVGEDCESHAECASGVCSELEGDPTCIGLGLCFPTCIACTSNTQCATNYCNLQTGTCETQPTYTPTGYTPPTS